MEPLFLRAACSHSIEHGRLLALGAFCGWTVLWRPWWKQGLDAACGRTGACSGSTGRCVSVAWACSGFISEQPLIWQCKNQLHSYIWPAGRLQTSWEGSSIFFSFLFPVSLNSTVWCATGYRIKAWTLGRKKISDWQDSHLMSFSKPGGLEAAGRDVWCAAPTGEQAGTPGQRSTALAVCPSAASPRWCQKLRLDPL